MGQTVYSEVGRKRGASEQRSATRDVRFACVVVAPEFADTGLHWMRFRA